MSELTPPVSARDHRRIGARARVTLVEYGDFECPHCGQAARVVQALQQQMGDQLTFVYRNFPLMDIHPHAKEAAEIAEAAAAQGRFWEMYTLLFSHQEALDSESLVGYARDLGLDLVQLQEGLSSGTFETHVQEDITSGLQSGVQGTPSYFINGQKYEGDWDLESLSAALADVVRV